MFSIAPVIETDRLRLRPGRLSDKDTHVAMWADARVTRFIGGEPRAPDVSWGKFLSSAGLWPVMGFGYWVFADKVSDALVGMGGLSYFGRGIPELEGLPEAGWAFDADHWGAGYATEAMTAALSWADAISMPPRCAASSIRGMTRRSGWRRSWGFGGSARATRWGMWWRFMGDPKVAESKYCHPGEGRDLTLE